MIAAAPKHRRYYRHRSAINRPSLALASSGPTIPLLIHMHIRIALQPCGFQFTIDLRDINNPALRLYMSQ